jgi:hypothetical protein
MALPHGLESVSVFCASEATQAPVYAIITPAPEPDAVDADVVDAQGTILVRLKGYRTIALPGTIDTAPLQALHAVAH